MIDGLALGETTPGPLIMVVAFGFVGGWTQQVLGPGHLVAGAALAACVVTWFTLLPSFLFFLTHVAVPVPGAPLDGPALAIAACALAGWALHLVGLA